MSSLLFKLVPVSYSIQINIPPSSLTSLEYWPSPIVNKILRSRILETRRLLLRLRFLESLSLSLSLNLRFTFSLQCFDPKP